MPYLRGDVAVRRDASRAFAPPTVADAGCRCTVQSCLHGAKMRNFRRQDANIAAGIASAGVIRAATAAGAIADTAAAAACSNATLTMR